MLEIVFWLTVFFLPCDLVFDQWRDGIQLHFAETNADSRNFEELYEILGVRAKAIGRQRIEWACINVIDGLNVGGQ